MAQAAASRGFREELGNTVATGAARF